MNRSKLLYRLHHQWSQQKTYQLILWNFPLPYNANIQVFFRAGVLGQMEELRDERLGKIMSWMQSWIRGYLTRKEFKKVQAQRVALAVIQRNLRKYMKLRLWGWFKLWQKVKPLLNVSRVEEQIAVSMPAAVSWMARRGVGIELTARGD